MKEFFKIGCIEFNTNTSIIDKYRAKYYNGQYVPTLRKFYQIQFKKIKI